MISTAIVLALILALAIWIYNRLVADRNQVKNAWSEHEECFHFPLSVAAYLLEDERQAIAEREKQRAEAEEEEEEKEEEEGKEDREEKEFGQWENYNLVQEYLRLRKAPLLKIMNYYLPKIKKVCK